MGAGPYVEVIGSADVSCLARCRTYRPLFDGRGPEFINVTEENMKMKLITVTVFAAMLANAEVLATSDAQRQSNSPAVTNYELELLALEQMKSDRALLNFRNGSMSTKFLYDVKIQAQRAVVAYFKTQLTSEEYNNSYAQIMRHESSYYGITYESLFRAVCREINEGVFPLEEAGFKISNCDEMVQFALAQIHNGNSETNLQRGHIDSIYFQILSSQRSYRAAGNDRRGVILGEIEQLAREYVKDFSASEISHGDPHINLPSLLSLMALIAERWELGLI